MAIDYGNEWKELERSTGHCTVVINNTGTTLGLIMADQIRNTVNNREKLMEKYVKANITTDIIGADTSNYKVKLEVYGESRGCVFISKHVFKAWCKKKGGK